MGTVHRLISVLWVKGTTWQSSEIPIAILVSHQEVKLLLVVLHLYYCVCVQCEELKKFDSEIFWLLTRVNLIQLNHLELGPLLEELKFIVLND